MGRQRILGASLAVAIAVASCHGTEAQYSIGGTISGTTGTVVLTLNGANEITQNGDGNFTFTHKLLQNDTFNVQVANPTGRCTVQNGAGTVGQSNIKDVNVSCADYANFPAGLLQIVIRSTNLTGAKVNPSVTTSASAVGGLIVDPTDKDTNGNVNTLGGLVLSGLTTPLTSVSINQAQKGNPTSNGGPIVTLILAADNVTAIVPPTFPGLSTTQLAALFAGELYFNVSTAANPNGELRGAIELQGGVGATVSGLDNTQVVPPTTSAAGGAGVLMVDRATRKLIMSYILHTVAAATAAGLNTTTVPPQILPFSNLQSGIDPLGTNLATPLAGSVLTEQNLADFDNSLLYFSVSSGTPPAAEIRGNISPLQ
jgi:hypothetical protein